MRNIVFSILVALATGYGLSFVIDDALAFDIVIGFAVGLTLFFVLTKKVMKEVEVLNFKAQKAIQKQNFDRAIKIYESGLDLRKKSPFVVGQLYGMIGMLHYIRKDNENALITLEKASNMNWMAKGMLAIIYMNNKEIDKMEKVFSKMVITGRKEGLAWALYAFCLYKLRRNDEAIKVLEEGNAKLKGNDERITKNLVELKNGRKLKMKLFGDAWYQFMLENPPKRMMPQQGQIPGQRIKKNSMYRG